MIKTSLNWPPAPISKINSFCLLLLLIVSCTLFAPQEALALTKPSLDSPANNATITNNSVKFSWSHPYNDNYELKIKTNGGTLKYASGKTTSKSKTVNLSDIPLTYGSTYKWYVVVYANGVEDSSGDNYFTYNYQPSPEAITMSPSSGSWTSSPQNLNVSSSNATTIYYRMVNTYDGSTPSDPSAPSQTSNDGSISGSSGTFQYYAIDGQLKKSKLRFVGCNSAGCGTVSGAYSYDLDLRPSPEAITMSPSSGSWTSSPQNLNVSSGNATTIYYRMVNTYDGSTPPDPSAPSQTSNDGSISGSSGTFQYYAKDGQLKKSKLRFVGCNSAGCGTVSGAYSYTLDLSNGITLTIAPTIAQTPMAGPPGVNFAQWGTGFTSNGTATLHFFNPNGEEILPTVSQPLDTSGHFDISYQSPQNKAPGFYTWWAMDDTSGQKSNEVTYDITAPFISPTIAQTPMKGLPGTAFAQWGTGFTPNGTATLHFFNPAGEEILPAVSQALDAIGHFDISYQSPQNKAQGFYTWWAMDDTSGQKSNEVTYDITAPFVSPTIAQTPMEGPPGTAFAQWGTGFTKNSTVTLHFRNQLQEELPTVQKTTDGQGAFSLSYTAPLDKPLGTHTWWAVDDTTGSMVDPLGYLITGSAGQNTAISTGPISNTMPPIKLDNDFGELTSEGLFYTDKETFIIVHGWNIPPYPSGLPDWMTGMGKDIAKQGYNVLYWNWQEKAKTKVSGIGGMIYDYTNDSSCDDMWVPFVGIAGNGSPYPTKNEIPFDETENSGKYLAIALKKAFPKDYAQSIHFVGHSLGTLVSTYTAKFAKKHPDSLHYADKIKHMVFLDSPCYNGDPGGSFLSDKKNKDAIFLENYISLLGRPYKDADVNVWLTKTANTTQGSIALGHQYSHKWYWSSVSNFSEEHFLLNDLTTPPGIMPWGFYWRNLTNQSTAQPDYSQSPAILSPNYLLYEGKPSDADLAVWEMKKGVVVDLSGMAVDAWVQIITPIADFAEYTRTTVKLLSLKTYDTAADTVGYATDVAGHAAQEVVDLKGHLTLTHASTAVLTMPVDIPPTANQLAFGLEFLYSPPGTMLEVFINDLPMYHTTSDLALGEGYQLVPWINVEQFAGQSVTMSMRLSNPNSDTEGKILIDDLVIAKIESGEVVTTITSTTAPVTTTTTTTSSSPTTITNPPMFSSTLSVGPGWSLLSSTIGFEVASKLGDQAQFTSVWKWADNGQGTKTWAVYLLGADSAAYAASKGFLTLVGIKPGEGFWVNGTAAAQPVQLSGSPAFGNLTLSKGWNLLGVNNLKSLQVAELGQVTSVWKWTTINGTKTWAVKLPGEGTPGAYAVSKGFGQFDSLEPGEGFWVNMPETPATTTTSTLVATTTTTIVPTITDEQIQEIMKNNVSGIVTSVDAQSITVKKEDGTSKTMSLVEGKTFIITQVNNEMKNATFSDIKVGMQAFANFESGTDMATTITIL